MFVEPCAKVDVAYYRNEVLLSKQLLPAIRSIAGDTFVFQQDNATEHGAGDTVALQAHTTPHFIAPDLWLLNSPDSRPESSGL